MNDTKILDADQVLSPMAGEGIELWEAGYSVIPIFPHHKKPGRYSSGSWFDLAGWQRYCQKQATEGEIESWAKWPGCGVGLALGYASGVIALDVDYTPEALAAAGMSELEEVLKSLLPRSLVMKRGRKGHTAFFRHTGEKGRKFKARGVMLVEILSTGNQTVLPPTIHPDTGEPYQWLTPDSLLDVKPDELPELPAGFIEQLENLLSPYQYDSERPGDSGGSNNIGDEFLTNDELLHIWDALQHIDPDCSYEQWVKVGMALHTIGDKETGFQMWRAWSAEGSKYDQAAKATLAARWRSFDSSKADGVSLDTVRYLARENGWIEPDKEVLVFIDDRPETLAKQAAAAMPTTTELPHARIKRKDIPAMTYGELEVAQMQTPDELYLWRDHVFFKGGLWLLAGPPKIGKSDLFLSACLAAACGGEFLGRRFKHPTRTLWIQAEIPYVFVRHRLMKKVNGGGYTPEQLRLINENLIVTDRVDATLTNDSDFNALRNLVREHNPGFIGIDPFINFSEADENDNSAMKTALRRVCLLRDTSEPVDPNGEPHQAMLGLLHHVRKVGKLAPDDPFELIRGAGAIRGYYDTGTIMRDLGGAVALDWECRHGPAPLSMVLERDAETLGWRVEREITPEEAAERADSDQPRKGKGKKGPKITFVDDSATTMSARLTQAVTWVSATQEEGLTRPQLIALLMAKCEIGMSSARAVDAELEKHPLIISSLGTGDKKRFWHTRFCPDLQPGLGAKK